MLKIMVHKWTQRGGISSVYGQGMDCSSMVLVEGILWKGDGMPVYEKAAEWN